MSNGTDLNEVRAMTLERINQAERRFRLAFFFAGALEILFLATFLLLMDIHNRLELLLLIAAVGTYSIIILGLVALGAHFNRGILRVLKSIELNHEDLAFRGQSVNRQIDQPLN